MKKSILISAAVLAYCILHSAYCYPQGTSVNITGTPADSSAILDVSSTTKGQLCPRMTTAQVNAISSPAVGLFVYNTDINCFQYWTGSTWLNDCGNQSAGNPVTGPCSAVGGYASASVSSGNCVGGYSSTLTLTGYNGNIQWQQSTDGFYFIDIIGAVSPSCIVTVYGSVMYYAAKVTLGSCAVSYSNIITLTASGCSPVSCNTFGWTAEEEKANSIVQTSDGGYAIAGNTKSFGAGLNDMYIVRINSDGTIRWTKTIGGTNDDYATSVVCTTDNGFAVCGYTNSFGAGSNDAFIAKLDSNGAILWTKIIGGSASDNAYSIIQTSDGGYATAGYTNSYGAGSVDVYIIKLDAAGGLTWAKTIGTSSDERGSGISQTSDGGYIISGYAAVGGYYDMYIAKTDGSGTLSWARTIGGASNDWSYSAYQTSDGGYLWGGMTVIGGLCDFYLVKLNSSGNLSWTKTYGGANDEWMSGMTLTSDGGAVITGRTNSFSIGNNDLFAVKVDGSGNLQWAASASGGSFTDNGSCVIQTADGGYAVAGYAATSSTASSNDMYVVKFDASGNCCCCTPRSPSVSSGGSVSTSASSNGSGGNTVSGGFPNSGGTKTILCN